MNTSEVWFEREFTFDKSNNEIIETLLLLSKTPSEIYKEVFRKEDELLEKKIDNKWSIKEHIGHLYDLEKLWINRIEDIKKGNEKMGVADLNNTLTNQSNHNNVKTENLVTLFTSWRNVLLDSISSSTMEELNKTSIHPRLNVPMRIIDLVSFIIEHDNHHLDKIKKIIKNETDFM